MSDRRGRAIALGIGGIAAVGLVDAAFTREPDLVALFAAIIVLCLVWVWTTLGTRSTLRVRSDLRAWLQLRSDVTGEDPEQIADRALTSYRLLLGDTTDRSHAITARDGPDRSAP
jgi:hypothetical protein